MTWPEGLFEKKFQGKGYAEFKKSWSVKNGLNYALSNAKFIITINSNTINDALVAGVPTMCFGPSLAINAGIAYKTTCDTIHDDIEHMINGWVPNKDKVINYLKWIVSRQWNLDELANGKVIKFLLKEANAL